MVHQYSVKFTQWRRTMPTKPKGKKGKKPPKKFDQNVQVAAGQKKEPPKGDVAGHGYYAAYYICWRCGRVNYVPGGIYAFYCWYDLAYNLAP
jgi:hypothetical protein